MMDNGPLQPEREQEASKATEQSADTDVVSKLLDATFGAPAPGLMIGPYRLGEIVDLGGSATVHRATDARNGQIVAIKQLASGYLAHPLLFQRFHREIARHRGLNHPNIVRVLGPGVSEPGTGGRPVPYLALEFIDGVDICKYVTDRASTVSEILRLIIQLCDAMQYAHEQGLLHRDLKPSNVLVTPDGTVKLIDFGLVRDVLSPDASATVYTHTGDLVGTPAYMSPEQADGIHRDLDARTDVYAIAALAYELLTGRQPINSKGYRAVWRLKRSRSSHRCQCARVRARSLLPFRDCLNKLF